MGGENTSPNPHLEAEKFVNGLNGDSSYEQIWQDLMSWDVEVASSVLDIISANTPLVHLQAARRLAEQVVKVKTQKEFSSSGSNFPSVRD